MELVLVIFSLFLVCNSQLVLSEERYAERDSKLVLVTGMFRHGERTPDPEQMREFPKYKYINDDFRPYGPGQLTHKGKETMYELGQKLRNRYAHKLFNRNWFNRYEIQMESTKYKRSLISAQIVLRGLLGYRKRKVLRRKWQYYRYLNNTLNAEKEFYYKFYYNEQQCPAYLLQLKEIFNLPLNTYKVSACFDPMTMMAKNLNVTDPSPLKVWYMSELYKGHRNAGKRLPHWVNDEMFQEMDKCINQFLKIAFGTTDLKQQSGGIYVNMMLKEFKNYIKHRDKYRYKKLRLYSAHDTTIAPAVAALGGVNGYTKNNISFLVDAPNYGSVILTELHKELITGKYFIKIYYWNDKRRQPTQLIVKGCADDSTGRCYLDQYSILVKNIRISKKKLRECKRLGQLLISKFAKSPQQLMN